MSNIRQITDWRMSSRLALVQERLLGALGSGAFGEVVRDSVTDVAGSVRRLYLFEARRSDDTFLQYWFGEPGLTEVFPAYLSRYHRLDPVHEAYRAAPRAADVALQRVRPRDIPSAGFRRRIFDDGGIVERISVLQRGAEGWRVMNVARHATDGCFSDREIETLVGLACLVLPLLPLNRPRPPAPLRLPQLEHRFATRFADLTPRERQVCARAALGMSVEATALDLGIGRTSVLTYRRRAYQRLGVTSPYELCALVAG